MSGSTPSKSSFASRLFIVSSCPRDGCQVISFQILLYSWTVNGVSSLNIRCLVASARSWFLAPETERSGARPFLVRDIVFNTALDGPWNVASGDRGACRGAEYDDEDDSWARNGVARGIWGGASSKSSCSGADSTSLVLACEFCRRKERRSRAFSSSRLLMRALDGLPQR